MTDEFMKRSACDSRDQALCRMIRRFGGIVMAGQTEVVFKIVRIGSVIVKIVPEQTLYFRPAEGAEAMPGDVSRLLCFIQGEPGVYRCSDL